MHRPEALADPPALVLTGERTLPGIPHENYWFRRHEVAYLALVDLVRGVHVLEAGCGEGYGAALLARTAAGVLAVDLDPTVTRHAAARYRLTALRADLGRLPLRTGSVDAVVSLQVVEHLYDQPGYVGELARVTRPGGLLALSTPNRLTFSAGHVEGEPPRNPFHTRELDADDLTALLAGQYRDVRLLGTHHGPRLRAFERQHGSVVDAQLAAPPEQWPPALAELVPTLRADDVVLAPDTGRTPLADSLDLLALARRR